nr:MAG TPA: hypothetical protein [Bacteriophage sp.]
MRLRLARIYQNTKMCIPLMLLPTFFNRVCMSLRGIKWQM